MFDGSIDHVWISFPEPPHRTQSTPNSSKRTRTYSIQQIPRQKKYSSYTRYDWNFLSTLSPTFVGWFCVINRIKQPMKELFEKREKRLDAVLTYFLIETTPTSTLPQSKLYKLFTPKTKCLLSHPVYQLITEFRKRFNQNTQIEINLQSNILPEIELLKQGIRQACRPWVQIFQEQSKSNLYTVHPSSSFITTSPINSMSTMKNNNHTDVRQIPIGIDPVRSHLEHEFVTAHSCHTVPTNSAVRTRKTVGEIRSNKNKRETSIETTTLLPSTSQCRHTPDLSGKNLVSFATQKISLKSA